MDLSASLRMLALSLLGLTSLLLAPAAGHAEDRDDGPKRFISLPGTGVVRTVPDKVDITTGVTSQAPTAKDALAKSSDALSKVIASLKSQGLDPKDIQTTNFSVQPVYEDVKDNRAPGIVGYRVSNQVSITVRDISRLGAILDEVVNLGANDIGAIQFGVAEPETMKDEARKLAVANAIDNAKIYAEAAGVKLGKVLTLTEDDGGYSPRFASPAPMDMAAKASVPIEAGTATVEMRVRVTFELE